MTNAPLSGHRPRGSVEWKAACGTEPRSTSSQATHRVCRPRGARSNMTGLAAPAPTSTGLAAPAPTSTSLPAPAPTVRRSYSRIRLGQEHSRARKRAALEELERPVRPLQREGRRRGADRDPRRLGEQLLAVGARVGGDAPDRALVEEVAFVLEGGHGSHVDPRERQRPAPREVPERLRHEVADRSEDDGPVRLHRHRVAKVAGPRRPEPTGELTVGRLARAHEHLAPSRARHLERDVGGRAEAVDAEPAAGRRLAPLERPVPDDARAEERRGVGIAEGRRDPIGERRGRDRVVREAAVGVVASELGALAEVLAARRAVRAGAARAAQPREAHARARLEARRPGARALDPADDLVAGNDRRPDERQVALDEVEVGATDAARADPDEDFVRARLGDRALLEAEGLVLDRGLGGEHEHPHTGGAPMWAPHPPSALIPSPRGPATSARARGAARPPSGP